MFHAEYEVGRDRSGTPRHRRQICWHWRDHYGRVVGRCFYRFLPQEEGENLATHEDIEKPIFVRFPCGKHGELLTQIDTGINRLLSDAVPDAIGGVLAQFGCCAGDSSPVASVQIPQNWDGFLERRASLHTPKRKASHIHFVQQIRIFELDEDVMAAHRVTLLDEAHAELRRNIYLDLI
jgi:hypothetical protein